MDMPGIFEFMDVLVYKLDENTNQIWLDTAFTGTYAQQSYNLKVKDSLVYVVGRTCHSVGTDSCDALLFFTDKMTGITGLGFIWDGGFGYEEIDGIAFDDDGIYITGWTAGNGTGINVLLMKIDFSGNLIWQKTWGSQGNLDDHQDGHIVMDDSMIYISGLFEGSPILGWDGYALLAKFDKSNGKIADSVIYGRQDPWFNAENALGMTSFGDFLYVTGYTTTSPNNWDIFVAKFDKNLQQIWYTTWGDSIETESARAIAVSQDGKIYVGGTTASFGNGGTNVVLIQYDTSGNMNWYKTWGGNLDDHALDIHIRKNDLFLTGKTKSFHPAQNWEAFLLKVELDSIVGINEQWNSIENDIYFVPNPMKETSTLRFNNSKNIPHRLDVFDVLGKKVLSIDNITTGLIKIEKGNLPNGIFIFQLWNGRQKIGAGKLVVE
jgi:Secretion system C-terminal sorting domain